MKPLPEAVQAAFPCDPDRLPSRPWWRSAGRNNGKPAYRRSDDCDSPTGFQYDVMRCYSPQEVAVKHDAANPLPHPGFRAGQVWAAEDGSSVALLAINKRNPAYPLMALDFGGDHEAVVDTWSTRPFSRCFPYLMADPACPWLAPWSPAENTP